MDFPPLTSRLPRQLARGRHNAARVNVHCTGSVVCIGSDRIERDEPFGLDCLAFSPGGSALARSTAERGGAGRGGAGRSGAESGEVRRGAEPGLSGDRLLWNVNR